MWTGNVDHFLESVDEHCLMVVPALPYILTNSDISLTVKQGPRWDEVAVTERRITRPQDGLIVIAYKATARHQGSHPYSAYCTSTYHRPTGDGWRMVQHQQTPVD